MLVGPTSSNSAGREGFVRNSTGPPIEGSKLPTQRILVGRGPVVGRSPALPMGVGNSNPGSELPTPTDFSVLSAHECVVSCIKC